MIQLQWLTDMDAKERLRLLDQAIEKHNTQIGNLRNFMEELFKTDIEKADENFRLSMLLSLMLNTALIGEESDRLAFVILVKDYLIPTLEKVRSLEKAVELLGGKEDSNG